MGSSSLTQSYTMSAFSAKVPLRRLMGFADKNCPEDIEGGILACNLDHNRNASLNQCSQKTC
jgi:hypothetical protein